MAYKRIIMEQGDDKDEDKDEEEYVPTSGEAFYYGMTSSWRELSHNWWKYVLGLLIFFLVVMLCC